MMVPSGPAYTHVVYSTLVCVGTMYIATGTNWHTELATYQ